MVRLRGLLRTPLSGNLVVPGSNPGGSEAQRGLFRGVPAFVWLDWLHVPQPRARYLRLTGVFGKSLSQLQTSRHLVPLPTHEGIGHCQCKASPSSSVLGLMFTESRVGSATMRSTSSPTVAAVVRGRTEVGGGDARVTEG